MRLRSSRVWKPPSKAFKAWLPCPTTFHMSVLGFREHSTISSHHLHFALNPALPLVSYRYGQDVSAPDPSCTRAWEKHVKTSAHGQGWILVCGLLLWPWRCSHSVKDRQGNSELQHTLDVRRANVGSRVKRPDPKGVKCHGGIQLPMILMISKDRGNGPHGRS